jgi:hypothetical protein
MQVIKKTATVSHEVRLMEKPPTKNTAESNRPYITSTLRVQMGWVHGWSSNLMVNSGSSLNLNGTCYTQSADKGMFIK